MSDVVRNFSVVNNITYNFKIRLKVPLAAEYNPQHASSVVYKRIFHKIANVLPLNAGWTATKTITNDVSTWTIKNASNLEIGRFDDQSNMLIIDNNADITEDLEFDITLSNSGEFVCEREMYLKFGEITITESL